MTNVQLVLLEGINHQQYFEFLQSGQLLERFSMNYAFGKSLEIVENDQFCARPSVKIALFRTFPDGLCTYACEASF